MSAPTVSVVMPVRNGERFVEQAAHSILEQTFSDLELVIVDDGSTDSTPTLLAAIGAQDERVVVLRSRRPEGIVDALNEGCRAARGSYLARMDADDVSLPNRIELQAGLLDATPDVGIVGGCMTCTNLSGSVSWPALYPPEDAEIRKMLPSANPFGHPTVTMRREAFESCGGYRDVCRHAEDYELWVRLLDRWRGANVSEPVLLYRVHTNQTAFRDWRQHCLSTLAVQASARIRHVEGGDPLEDVELVSEATLRELGVSEHQIRTRIVESLTSLSNLAGYAGSAAERNHLLAVATAEAGRGSIPRQITAKLALVQAQAAFEEGARVRGIGKVLNAARADSRAAAHYAYGFWYRRLTRLWPARYASS